MVKLLDSMSPRTGTALLSLPRAAFALSWNRLLEKQLWLLGFPCGVVWISSLLGSHGKDSAEGIPFIVRLLWKLGSGSHLCLSCDRGKMAVVD